MTVKIAAPIAMDGESVELIKVDDGRGVNFFRRHRHRKKDQNKTGGSASASKREDDRTEYKQRGDVWFRNRGDIQHSDSLSLAESKIKATGTGRQPSIQDRISPAIDMRSVAGNINQPDELDIGQIQQSRRSPADRSTYHPSRTGCRIQTRASRRDYRCCLYRTRQSFDRTSRPSQYSSRWREIWRSHPRWSRLRHRLTRRTNSADSEIQSRFRNREIRPNSIADAGRKSDRQIPWRNSVCDFGGSQIAKTIKTSGLIDGETSSWTEQGSCRINDVRPFCETRIAGRNRTIDAVGSIGWAGIDSSVCKQAVSRRAMDK